MSPPQEKGLGPGVGLSRRSGWTGCFHCPSSLLPATPPQPPYPHLPAALLPGLCFEGKARHLPCVRCFVSSRSKQYYLERWQRAWKTEGKHSRPFLWPVPLAALVGLETRSFVVVAAAVPLSFNLIAKAFLSLLLDICQNQCFLAAAQVSPDPFVFLP